MFGRFSILFFCAAGLTCTGLLAEDESFNSRLGHIRIGQSKMADIVEVFGEPGSYYDADGAYSKESLPDRYYADFPQGFVVLMLNGMASSIEVTTPEFLLSCRLRTGDNLLDVFELLGHPSGITVGPLPAAFSDRTLYFENEDYSGGAVFPDNARGIRLFFKDGMLTSVLLRNQRANQGWLPAFTSATLATSEADLKSANLCGTDLREHLQTLLHSQFDDRTVWPPSELLPPEFVPAEILDKATNPGLGVRELHKQGITGKGVAIAIVDSTPRLDHLEYSSRLRQIEWVDAIPSMAASYHGGLVTSLAAGATIGVAPEADIYYFIAPTTYAAYAKAVRRVIEVNRTLAEGDRIRVLSISWGWRLGDPTAVPFSDAIKEANAEGIFVVTPAITLQQGYSIFGMGRDPLSDPDDVASYEPGLFLQPDFFANSRYYTSQFWVPMDARLMAGQNGPESYYFYRVGGLSDAIPWFAGMYALACQVNPGMTAELMKSAATQTARNVEFTHEDQTYTLRGVIDPAALIDAVRTQ